jgi:hypothetical protein
MKPPSTALARLAQSRQLLQQSLHNRPAAPGIDGIGSIGSSFADLKSVPVLALLFELTQVWWRKQPLGLAAMLLADQCKASLLPLARRHPLALVCGAALLGGLLVRLRPWRLLKPALFAGLAQELLVKARSGASLEAWLAALASLAQTFSSSSAPAPAAPSAAAAAAHQDT